MAEGEEEDEEKKQGSGKQAISLGDLTQAPSIMGKFLLIFWSGVRSLQPCRVTAFKWCVYLIKIEMKYIKKKK